jgi:hypothetical protein
MFKLEVVKCQDPGAIREYRQSCSPRSSCWIGIRTKQTSEVRSSGWPKACLSAATALQISRYRTVALGPPRPSVATSLSLSTSPESGI